MPKSKTPRFLHRFRASIAAFVLAVFALSAQARELSVQEAVAQVQRDTSGKVFSTEGRQLGFTGAGSKVRGSASQLRAPELARVAAPMTRATVRARGGFGAARSASFGG